MRRPVVRKRPSLLNSLASDQPKSASSKPATFVHAVIAKSQGPDGLAVYKATTVDDIQTSHLFPYMNGQDTMDTIYGKKRPAEPFPPRNGLVLCKRMERYPDAGKFVILPDIGFQDNAVVSAVKQWLEGEQKYRGRLIDDQVHFFIPSN